MCVVSMVMEHYRERWEPRRWQPWPVQPLVIHDRTPRISQEEIDEFRRLLERAKKYDRDHNEPDCELDEKRQALKTLANELGVEIDFV